MGQETDSTKAESEEEKGRKEQGTSGLVPDSGRVLDAGLRKGYEYCLGPTAVQPWGLAGGVGEGSWGTAQGFGLWSHTPPPEVSVSKAVKWICSKLGRGDFFETKSVKC